MRPKMTVQYKQRTLDVLVVNGAPYLFVQQILMALGLASSGCENNNKQAQKKIISTVTRCSADMTAAVEVETVVGPYLTRIFSLEGAVLLAQEADTPESEAFAQWVRGLTFIPA